MATKKKKTYEIDMCTGPLFGKILLFYFPLMISGVLQLFFNAADVIVVGRFAGEQALAAVGSTGALNGLIINVFMGLSIGTNVLVARFYGAGQEKEVEETVHTSMMASVICGFLLVIIGIVLAYPSLKIMGTPEDVIDQSILYMRIYFIGMPVVMAYNFGSAILRAVGDTKRPLYYLMVAGVINVILNLIFVIVFSMGVAGVAWATVISQSVSAALVVRCLLKTESSYRLVIKSMRIVPDKLLKMIQIGVPAGLQGALFAVANVLIQSSVNSFGSLAMAGNTAASNIESFVHTAMYSFHQSAISFTGQNYGAKNYKRIGRICLICELSVGVVGLVMGNTVFAFARPLLQLYSSDPVVIEYGILRISIICTTYFLCGVMDTIVGSLRGMGRAIMPTIVSLTGICVFRTIWINTIFRQNHTLTCLYLSYPISWIITFTAHLIFFFVAYRKLFRNNQD